MNKTIQYLFYFICLIAVSACQTKAKEETQTTTNPNVIQLTDAQFKSVGLLSDTMSIQTLQGDVKVNGVIDVPPQNMVSVGIPLGGFLKSTHLLPGMKVKKGEIIAVLEDQQYIQLQQDYLTALAEFSYIEKEFKRQQELNQSKAISDKSYEQIKASYQTQKITIKALSEKLRLIGIQPENLNENTISKSINLLSPINGFVSKVNVNIGRYITASDVLFELVNPDDIHLNLTVYEKDIASLKIGSKVKAFTNTNPNKVYQCDVILIGQDVSKEGYVQIHCHFDTYSSELIPGMYMNADISTDGIQAKVLPEQAVVSYEGKDYVVLAQTNKQYKLIEVKVLKRSGTWVQIDYQANNQEAFVVKGTYDILMMAKNSEAE
jgi:cobalt-zinc-cadmium efflux system membrane fusion protein